MPPSDGSDLHDFLNSIGETPSVPKPTAKAPVEKPVTPTPAAPKRGSADVSDGSDLSSFLKSVGAPQTSSEAPAETDLSSEPLHEQFRVGMKQGLLGYAEAPAYYAEKAIRQFKPEFRLNPFGIRDWAKAYRERAESTPAGVAGEMAGTVAPLFLPGLGELGFAGRAAMGAEDLSRMARLAEGFRAAQAGSKVGKVATEAARPGEIWAKGFSEVERNKGDLGKLSEIIGKNRPVEAPPVAEVARPRLQFQAPPPQSMLSRVAAGARGMRDAYQGINPLVRGGLQGGVMALLSRPATTPEEAEDQFLTGLFLGAGGAQLRLPHYMPKFIDGEWGRIRTPAGKAARARELRKILAGGYGRRLQSRMREIMLRSAGFFAGHAVGHAMGVPGAGWVGGHFLGETLPYLARRGTGGISDIIRRAGLAATAHPGPTGAAISPLMGYPVPYQLEEDENVQP